MAFGEALKANDWSAAARLMHPSALHQLRELFEPLTGAPRAGDIATQLFGVSSAAELATTPDTVLFARFLQTVLSQQAGVAEMFRSASLTPLGHVNQPGDTVFVVSRMTMTVEGITVTSFDVMPFLLYQGAYRGLLKADFTNFAAMLQARLGKRS